MKRTKILLVEDDTSLGFLLVDFLESNGFEVKLYRDGESGLNGYRAGSYDFCIFDVMLPGIDGFSLARRIRAEIPRRNNKASARTAATAHMEEDEGT